MDLLNDLNDEQRAEGEYIDGPSLVIAGAGSGKTRVLTYKIAYLLSQGMKPWSIMALTFTNKAAREMKERIGKLVGDDLAQHLYMGTFIASSPVFSVPKLSISVSIITLPSMMKVTHAHC